MNLIRRIICITILATFIGTTVFPPSLSSAQVLNSSTLNLLPLTSSFEPALVKGIKVFPDNPLRFDFIVDPGQSGLTGDALKAESTKFIKYFLASVTTPDKDMWVNLSPYEKNRIIPEEFGQTLMGQDLLAQDYILKQLTASLLYPEKELGKKFWEKVYAKVKAKYGQSEIPLETFNKVWIVPDKAAVYTKNDVAYITESHLKVMMEEDYLSLQSAVHSPQHAVDSRPLTVDGKAQLEVLKQIIIPELEREVNEGKHFVQLRQMYQMMILATWFKRNLNESFLGKIYLDQNKIDGVDSTDKNGKQKIYDQYLEIFKKGAYDTIKEDYDPLKQEIVNRKYISGGFDRGALADVFTEQKVPPAQGLKSSDQAVLVSAMVNPLKAGKNGDGAMTIPNAKDLFEGSVNPEALQRAQAELKDISRDEGARVISRLDRNYIDRFYQDNVGLPEITFRGNVQTLTAEEYWGYEDTPLTTVDPYGVIEDQIRKFYKEYGSSRPMVILDWGLGKGVTLTDLYQKIEELKIRLPGLQVKLYGLSKSYYYEWKKIPRDITVIFDTAENLAADLFADLLRNGLDTRIDFIFSYSGIVNVIGEQETPNPGAQEHFEELRKMLHLQGEIQVFGKVEPIQKFTKQLEAIGFDVVDDREHPDKPLFRLKKKGFVMTTAEMREQYNELKAAVQKTIGMTDKPIQDRRDDSVKLIEGFMNMILMHSVPMSEELVSEVRSIFNDGKTEIISELKKLGVMEASILPTMDHWLAESLRKSFGEDLVLNGTRILAQVSPEGSVLFLGMVSIHQRLDPHFDRKLIPILFKTVLKELKVFLANEDFVQARKYYIAVLNSLLFTQGLISVPNPRELYKEDIKTILSESSSDELNPMAILKDASRNFSQGLNMNQEVFQFNGTIADYYWGLLNNGQWNTAYDLMTETEGILKDGHVNPQNVPFMSDPDLADFFTFAFDYLIRAMFEEASNAAMTAEEINQQFDAFLGDMRVELEKKEEGYLNKLKTQLKNVLFNMIDYDSVKVNEDKTELQKILKRVEAEALSVLREAGLEEASAYSTADEWLAFSMIRTHYFRDFKRRAKTLSIISPKAAVVFLGAIGIHYRMGKDSTDLRMVPILLESILPELANFLSDEKKLTEAREYYIALLGGLLFYITDAPKELRLEEYKKEIALIMEQIQGVDQPEAIMERAGKSFGDDITMDIDIFRAYMGIDKFVSLLKKDGQSGTMFGFLTGKKGLLKNGSFLMGRSSSEFKLLTDELDYLIHLPVPPVQATAQPKDKEKKDTAMTAEEIKAEISGIESNLADQDTATLRKNMDDLSTTILNSYVQKIITLTEARDILDDIKERIIKNAQAQGLKLAEVLPEAGHWLAFRVMRFNRDGTEWESWLRALGEISPEGAALFLGVIGMHHRKHEYESNDFKAESILLSFVLPEMDRLLDQGEVDQARKYYVAVLNNFLFGNYSESVNGSYAELVTNTLSQTSMGLEASLKVLKKAQERFSNVISVENIAFRYMGPTFGDTIVLFLADEPTIVTAWDLVNGTVNDQLGKELDANWRLDPKRFSLIGETKGTEKIYVRMKEQFTYLTKEIFEGSVSPITDKHVDENELLNTMRKEGPLPIISFPDFTKTQLAVRKSFQGEPFTEDDIALIIRWSVAENLDGMISKRKEFWKRDNNAQVFANEAVYLRGEKCEGACTQAAYDFERTIFTLSNGKVRLKDFNIGFFFNGEPHEATIIEFNESPNRYLVDTTFRQFFNEANGALFKVGQYLRKVDPGLVDQLLTHGYVEINEHNLLNYVKALRAARGQEVEKFSIRDIDNAKYTEGLSISLEYPYSASETQGWFDKYGMLTEERVKVFMDYVALKRGDTTLMINPITLAEAIPGLLDKEVKFALSNQTDGESYLTLREEHPPLGSTDLSKKYILTAYMQTNTYALPYPVSVLSGIKIQDEKTISANWSITFDYQGVFEVLNGLKQQFEKVSYLSLMDLYSMQGSIPNYRYQVGRLIQYFWEMGIESDFEIKGFFENAPQNLRRTGLNYVLSEFLASFVPVGGEIKTYIANKETVADLERGMPFSQTLLGIFSAKLGYKLLSLEREEDLDPYYPAIDAIVLRRERQTAATVQWENPELLGKYIDHAMTVTEIEEKIKALEGKVNTHIVAAMRSGEFKVNSRDEESLKTDIKILMVEILDSHHSGDITTEKSQDILKDIEAKIIKPMRELGVRLASTLQKADHWLAYATMQNIEDQYEEILKNRLRSLGKITPEGAALFLGFVGLHHRNLGLDPPDMDYQAILLKEVLPAIDVLLDAEDKETARQYYIAVLGSMMPGNFDKSNKPKYSDFVKSILVESKLDNAEEILKRASKELSDGITVNNLAFRYVGNNSGVADIDDLALEDTPVSAWDLVSGQLDQNLRLKRNFFLIGETTGTAEAYNQLKDQLDYLMKRMFEEKRAVISLPAAIPNLLNKKIKFKIPSQPETEYYLTIEENPVKPPERLAAALNRPPSQNKEYLVAAFVEANGMPYPVSLFSGIEMIDEETMASVWSITFDYPKLFQALEELRYLFKNEDYFSLMKSYFVYGSNVAYKYQLLYLAQHLSQRGLTSDEAIKRFFNQAPRDLRQKGLSQSLSEFLASFIPIGGKIKSTIANEETIADLAKGIPFEQTLLGVFSAKLGYKLLSLKRDEDPDPDYPSLDEIVLQREKQTPATIQWENPELLGKYIDRAMTIGGPEQVSKQPTDKVGGIDFNSNQLNLKSKGDVIKYNLPPEYQNMDFNNITGFTPVIFQMVPMTNLPLFLGIGEKPKVQEEISMK